MSSVRSVTYVAGCSTLAQQSSTSPSMGEVGAKRREGVEPKAATQGQISQTLVGVPRRAAECYDPSVGDRAGGAR
jgi:hypothetical protein